MTRDESYASGIESGQNIFIDSTPALTLALMIPNHVHAAQVAHAPQAAPGEASTLLPTKSTS